MGLSEIAAGLEVTAEQQDRGVPTVDGTDASLEDRVAEYADSLPCEPAAAARVVEHHAAGGSVGDSARAAGVAPMTAAKALHRCGVPGVTPLSPTARDVLGDWLDGRLSRADALALTGANETEFALAAYVETHDPVAELAEAVDGAFSPDESATVAKRNALSETMSGVSDLY